MTKKARLRYFDSNNNSVIIGSLNDTEGATIDQLTLKNSGREFTNAVVDGSNSMFGEFPTKAGDVTPQNNASGPEIFLEVFNQSTNQYEVRDRLYAENQGVVTNDGRLKHKRLYGFEKFTGRQRVEITTPVTTNIEDVLKEALPSGYTVQAQAPSSGSIPSVNSFTFKGERNKLYKTLEENYGYFIFFTGETDGNGDYIVKLEPRGFGSQVDTLEKGVDPVFFTKWTKNDELRRITEAEVIGTDTNGNKIQATASTNPNNGRFIRKNATYITNQAEAKEIAVNLIAADSDGGTPQDVEHGKIEAPIDTPPANNLNKSIQVINSEINVDDLFTIVEQRDFFHQSQTQYSFEFEKELTAREREDKKDLGNRNAELIVGSEKDVGGQSINDDTQGGSATLQRDQDVDAEGSSTDTPKEIRRDPNTDILDLTQGESMVSDFVHIQRDREEQGSATVSLDSNGNGSETVFLNEDFTSDPKIQVTPNADYVDRFRTNNISSNSFEIQALNGPANTDVEFHYYVRGRRENELSGVNFDVETPPSITQIESSEGEFGGATFTMMYGNQAGFDVSVEFIIENTDTGETYVNFTDQVPDGQNRIFNDFVSVNNTSLSSGDTLSIQFDTVDAGGNQDDFETAGDSLFQTRAGFIVQSINKHNHDDDIEIEDEDGNSKPDMVKETTADANITSQPKFTEDGQHVHTIDVTTEQEIINLLEEDKTNR